jgi:hypothetical protein
MELHPKDMLTPMEDPCLFTSGFSTLAVNGNDSANKYVSQLMKHQFPEVH